MQTVEKTTLKEKQLASSSLIKFTSAIKRNTGLREIKIKIQESGELITVPIKALNLLSVILSNMAEGKSISIIPSDSEVSTQQAADMLNISRPHIVKLLEQGKIPFKKVGSHRRILLDDLMSYELKLKTQRKESLKFLAKQAQDLKLGYE